MFCWSFKKWEKVGISFYKKTVIVFFIPGYTRAKNASLDLEG